MRDKHLQMIDEEIERLESKELTWQTCDKLCMLYQLREHMGGHSGEAMRKHHYKLTREDAEAWMHGLRGEDPAVPYGPKWSMKQVEPIAIKYGVQPETEECVELWAVMNALYSDYYAVAKKHNVVTPEFFADMAMAFLHDKDAVGDKAAVYYECIAKK